MANAIQLLRDMIAIPSVNPMRAHTGEPVEKQMASFIETVLSRNGIECQRQKVTEGRDNVIGIVHATGSERNGLMLNSHMDTVPVDNMSIKPFDPVIKNGCVFGRGSCDAKASIAAMLAAVIDYANQADRPSPVVFAAMADEEFAFSGSWKLIENSWPAADGQQTLRDCEQFLRERLDGSVRLEFEDPYLIDPPLETAPDAAVVAVLARSQQEALGHEREVAGANYGTDGSKLSRMGIQTVVCGPGNIAQAHTANEFVEIEQVELATRMYRHMLATWHAQQS